VASDLYYGDASLNKQVFVASAIVTAPIIYSTAAGTGGPLLWNGSSNVMGRILKVGWAVTTAAAAAGGIGFTGGAGQTTAPSSTTAIDTVANLYMGGPKPSITPYRIGTVTTAGTFILPFADIGTSALTTHLGLTWTDVGRLISIPPNGGWCSVASTTTLTTAVMTIAIVWEEIQLPIG